MINLLLYLPHIGVWPLVVTPKGADLDTRLHYLMEMHGNAPMALPSWHSHMYSWVFTGWLVLAHGWEIPSQWLIIVIVHSKPVWKSCIRPMRIHTLYSLHIWVPSMPLSMPQADWPCSAVRLTGIASMLKSACFMCLASHRMLQE